MQNFFFYPSYANGKPSPVFFIKIMENTTIMVRAIMAS
jgi:hypothetical protein